MEEKDVTQFRSVRIKELEDLYSDDMSTRRRYNRTPSYSAQSLPTAAAVRQALSQAISNPATVVELSEKLYATNTIYASVIDYLANAFMWRYHVIPHRVYTHSKAKSRKQISTEDYNMMYNLMLEIADGLSFKTKCPAILKKLFIEGSAFYTTLSDEDSLTVDTLLLPTRYCRKVGETQFGTAIIEFDFSYFQNQGLAEKDLKEYFKSFPKEFEKGYRAYLRDANNRWGQLDPRFSSGIMMNEVGIPTLLYMYGGLLDFEKYQDNELERNENTLKYLVVQTIPHYENELLFEVDEVKALHRSLRKIIDSGDKTRLVTTYGDIKVQRVSESDTAENQVLSKAFKTIFNNAGLNSAIFTSESVEALKLSLVRDKSTVWQYIQQLINFYNIAVNNWFDFKGYQADIDILPISSYTYNDDIKVYRDNATLGVNKLDYFISSGIEQRHISDMLMLEKTLGLDQIQPMQTSYTQTAEDRNVGESDEDTSGSDTGIEPSEKEPVDPKQPAED